MMVGDLGFEVCVGEVWVCGWVRGEEGRGRKDRDGERKGERVWR